MTGPRFLGLRGTITLRIIGACPEEFLMRLVNCGFGITGRRTS